MWTSENPPEVEAQSEPDLALQSGQAMLKGLVGRTSGIDWVRFITKDPRVSLTTLALQFVKSPWSHGPMVQASRSRWLCNFEQWQ
jgi:hypothetical protein